MADEITRADVQKARQALAKCPEAEEAIRQCEQCDIEIQELRDRWKHATNFLTKFLALNGNQFPGRA